MTPLTVLVLFCLLLALATMEGVLSFRSHRSIAQPRWRSSTEKYLFGMDNKNNAPAPKKEAGGGGMVNEPYIYIHIQYIRVIII